jgi:Icc protein
MPVLTGPCATRRQFLATIGAAAASLTFAPRTSRALQGASRPLRLALLSDTHVPANPAEEYRGFRPVDNLARVVTQVLATPAEGVLIGGDLARLQGLPEDYARLREVLAPVLAKMPAGLIVGNHDHRENFRQTFPAAGGAPPALANKHTTTHEAGGLRFVLLDSLLATDVTPGQLGTAQRSWLASQLAASSTPTVILVHHTLGGNDGELMDAERLFDVLPFPQIRSDRARQPATHQPACRRLQLRRQRARRLDRLGVDRRGRRSHIALDWRQPGGQRADHVGALGTVNREIGNLKFEI